MIKFLSPITGVQYAQTPNEALERCRKEALKEAKETTGLYSTISGTEATVISVNKKNWTIYVKRQT